MAWIKVGDERVNLDMLAAYTRTAQGIELLWSGSNEVGVIVDPDGSILAQLDEATGVERRMHSNESYAGARLRPGPIIGQD